MIKPIFAIKDEAAGIFMDPMTDINKDTAIRNFEFAFKNNQIINFRPSDFSLWHVADYDNESGEVLAVVPDLIMRGNDYGND